MLKNAFASLLLLALLVQPAASGPEHSLMARPARRDASISTLAGLPSRVLQAAEIFPALQATELITVDLGLVKDATPPVATAGAPLTYTLTVSNLGPDDSSSSVLTDTLPAEVGYLSASPECGPAGGLVICNLGQISGGATLPLTISISLPPSLTGQLINSAVVQSAETDPSLANNTTVLTTTVAATSDLSLLKTASDSPVTAGLPLTYTLTVTNNGPSDATGVVLTDTLPASGILFESANPSQGTCSGTATVICDLGTLSAAGVATTTIRVAVDPGATGSLLNEALAGTSSDDPFQGNNTASLTTPIVSSADLSLTKQDDPDPVVAGGGPLTYTLTVTNGGPSEASNVSVGDTLPVEVTYQGSSASQGSCSHTSGTVICSLGGLGPGAVGLVTITVGVPADVQGPLSNNAVATSTTPDPNEGDNSQTEITQVAIQADLALSKTGFPEPVVAGDPLTYTLTITNSGPSYAPAVVLTDTLPAGVTYLSATPAQGSCSPSGGLVLCDLLDLPAGLPTSVIIVGTVDPSAQGTLSNQAVVASQGEDLNPGDNSAIWNTAVTSLADLVLTKTDTPSALAPGGILTYTVAVLNSGPSNAAGVVMTDTLPSEVTLQSAAASQGTCSGMAVVLCDFGDLTAGTSVTATLVVAVDGATPPGSIFNTATTASITPDPDPANNSQVEETQISTEIVDLVVTKDDDVDPLSPGDTLSYSLQITNLGPSLATNVVLTDTLPGAVAFVSATPAQGSCQGGPVVTCNLGSLPASASTSVTIIVTVDMAAGPMLTNTAEVGADQADSDKTNNTDQETTTVIQIADLAITKQDDPDPVIAGTGILTYTLTVTNTGPSTASGVVVTDTLPAGLTFLSASPGPPACQFTTGQLTCNLAPVPPGTSAVVTIRTAVGAGTSGSLFNQVTTTSSALDPNPFDNVTSETTLVLQDTQPPTVTWISPVPEGETFFVGNQTVRLEVDALDDTGVKFVLFKRWIPATEVWLTIGTVTSPPYILDLDASGLVPTWNEVRAEAHDLAGKVSESHIWMYHYPHQRFLALLAR